MIIATTDYTLELEIHAEITPGRPGITNAPPDHCEPPEAPTVDISDVWILRSDGLPSQRLVEVSPAMLEVLAVAVLEQAEDGKE